MATTSYNIYQQITSVRLASTANLAGQYFNGQLGNGVGSTLTALSVGSLSLDGISTLIGDRVLLKDQTNPGENGIYFVQNPGSAISVWVLQRAPDFQSLEQLKIGQYFSVGAGNTLAGNIFVLIEPLPSVIGIGSFSFADISPGGGGGGPFFAIANNLSESSNPQTLFTNVGLGSGQVILITDADFSGGFYTLNNPCPNYIRALCATPGQTIRLPSATGFESFALSQGPVIDTLTGFQPVAVQDATGGAITTVGSPGSARFISTDNSTPQGSWAFRNQVYTVNGVSGDVVIPSGVIGSPEQLVYVSNDGSDLSGDGTIENPYATLSFAISQITDNSSVKPYSIIMATGIYSETNLSLKPWIYIVGNNSQITVTNTVVLDASWSGSGDAGISNLFNCDFQGGFNLDFDAVAAPFAVFTFEKINGGTNYTYTINGSTAGTTIIVLNNIVGYTQQQSIDITNCYGGIALGAVNDLSITQSDPGSGHVFNVQNMQILNDYTVSSLNNTIISFTNGILVNGNAVFTNVAPGQMLASSFNSIYSGGIKVDGDANLSFNVDGLNTTPVIVGTPVINYISLSDGISANVNFTPANYIPTAGVNFTANSITGNLAGIDLAIAGATGVPPAYGEMFFQGNASTTTITAANTPVKVNATYSSGILSGFSQATGTLTYTDTPARTVFVSADLTATYNGTSQNTSFYVALNGVVIAKSKQSTYIGAITPANQANPCKGLVSLVTGDTLELWVENNDNANDIIVSDLNFTVQGISGFDSGSLTLAGENYLSLSGSTLTANPVNLAGTNVTGLLPLNKVADISITINGMSINGSGGVNAGAAVLASQEMRVGNMVTGSILISFNSQVNNNFFTITKSYGGVFTLATQALGSGICNLDNGASPPGADGSVCTRVQAIGAFGVRIDTTVTSLSTNYLAEATFTYQVI